MKRLTQNYGFLLVVTAMLLLLLGVATSTSNKGIHKVSENAVYISGEVCTVNMQFDRPVTEITEEMNQCVKLHKTYKRTHQL